MALHLSRRTFLSASAQTAVGALVYSTIEAKGQNVLVQSFLPNAMIQSGAMQPVFAKLDEYIARHMRETGAPGLTLALANHDGLLRGTATVASFYAKVSCTGMASSHSCRAPMESLVLAIPTLRIG
jgi:hypothetical protein